MKNIKILIFLFFYFVSPLFFSASIYAQEGDPVQKLQEDVAVKEQEKQKLREQLQALEQELQKIQEEVNAHKQEADGYDRDISILKAEIRGIEIKIERNQLVINQTDFAIGQNEETVVFLEEKADKQKELLGKIILSIYKLDDVSSVEIILTSNTISEFFNDINHIKTLQESMKDTLEKVNVIKSDIEKEQAQIEQKAQEVKVLLQSSRSKEYAFREVAQTKQKTISEVRNQLFVLEGAGVATSFGEAYEYAKVASSITGVRPAFLLAVLKRESSWVQNVGLCYLVDVNTGSVKGKNTGTVYSRVMKPSRDVRPFLEITSALGLDPFATAVSCPHPRYGYGGAMGPAQFIPSTWMAYRERVSAILGREANPWLIQDAFIASR